MPAAWESWFWAANALGFGATAAWILKVWWFTPYGDAEEDMDDVMELGQPAGLTLDIKRQDIRWLGPRKEDGHDWALLDGIIYGWSESNVQYESVWWLKSDGTPIKAPENSGRQGLLDALNRDRPFDPEWLNGS